MGIASKGIIVPSIGDLGDQVAENTSLIESLDVAVDAITADPANAVTQIWIPAQALQLVSGSASISAAAARIPCWLLPDGASTFLSTVVRVPSHWLTMSVKFIASNIGANAGNVVFVGGVHDWAIGDSFNVSPTESNVTAVIPSTAWVTATSTTVAALTVDSSKFTTLRIARQGASANDTLPNNVALIGVIIEKVT